MASRCKFWLPKKKRFCAIPPIANSEFCGNHSKRSDDVWILCSIDPSHSVLESNLESHLKRCPLLKHTNSLSLQPFYQKGINGGGEEDDHEGVTSESKRMAVQSMTEPHLINLIEKIKSVHDSVCKDILDSYIVPDACRSWINRAIDWNIPFQEKHVIQQASILGNLEKLGALNSSSIGEQLHCNSSSPDSPAVVEFGAGRGYLTQMLADCYGVSKVFLIERKSYKLKADRSLRQKERLILERLRIDIEDLNLNAIEALKGLPYLAIGKHLCGPATDMTIRCCVGEGVAKSNLGGLSIATCCHHLCQWKHYISKMTKIQIPTFFIKFVAYLHVSLMKVTIIVSRVADKDFFLNLGLTKDVFHAITWFTSWAVDADHSSDVSDTNMDTVKDIGGGINMSARERAELGFMCKDIIDAGRLMWMKEYGLESKLVKYVPSNISPENHLLIARR